MDESKATLETLGRQVAETLGAGPSEQRRAAQQQALLAALDQQDRPQPARGRTKWVALAAAAAVLLVAVGGYLALRTGTDAPLPFRVGEELALGQEGAWLEAPADRVLPVNFSDEAHLSIEPGSSGRVLESRQRRVRVGLDRGKVRMNVRRKGVRAWQVEAGPYRVGVVGTEFDVSWQPDARHLEVHVRSGRVLVRGRGLDPEGVRLGPGDRLLADRDRPVTVFGAAAKEAEPTVPPPAPEPEIDTPARELAALEPPPRRSRQRTSPQRPEPRDWRALHADGRYSEALAAARAQGFPDLLTRLDAAGLRELADSARFSGQAREAEQALLALRERFPQDRRARVAAFLLGRVAMDLAAKPGLAVTWFQTYLDEDARGPLAEEALGRLVDACARAGQRAKARATARRYLEQYPEGVFGELARSVLKD